MAFFGFNYRGLETGETEPPLSELYLIGGPGTLRGFRNDRFVAQRTAFASVEPRLRFRTAYLFLFYDGAYLNRRTVADSGTVTNEDYRYGYGLGLAVADANRSVKLSLGWNEETGFDQPRLSIELQSDL